MKNLVCTSVALALVGCAAIEPNALHVGVQHLSSISQHFGPEPTNIGNEMATVSAMWHPSKFTYLEVQDGWIFRGADFGPKGGHEIFEARAGLSLELKP
jgi:hypothetical protein